MLKASEQDFTICSGNDNSDKLAKELHTQIVELFKGSIFMTFSPDFSNEEWTGQTTCCSTKQGHNNKRSAAQGEEVAVDEEDRAHLISITSAY